MQQLYIDMTGSDYFPDTVQSVVSQINKDLSIQILEQHTIDMSNNNFRSTQHHPTIRNPSPPSSLFVTGLGDGGVSSVENLKRGLGCVGKGGSPRAHPCYTGVDREGLSAPPSPPSAAKRPGSTFSHPQPPPISQLAEVVLPTVEGLRIRGDASTIVNTDTADAQPLGSGNCNDGVQERKVDAVKALQITRPRLIVATYNGNCWNTIKGYLKTTEANLSLFKNTN